MCNRILAPVWSHSRQDGRIWKSYTCGVRRSENAGNGKHCRYFFLYAPGFLHSKDFPNPNAENYSARPAEEEFIPDRYMLQVETPEDFMVCDTRFYLKRRDAYKWVEKRYAQRLIEASDDDDL